MSNLRTIRKTYKYFKIFNTMELLTGKIDLFSINFFLLVSALFLLYQLLVISVND